MAFTTACISRRVAIAAAVRTPIGRHGGPLGGVRAGDLAARAVRAVVTGASGGQNWGQHGAATNSTEWKTSPLTSETQRGCAARCEQTQPRAFFLVAGGFAAGWVSDKLFQSRRAPSAAFMQIIMFATTGIMTLCLTLEPVGAIADAAAPGSFGAWLIAARPLVIGICAVTTMMAVGILATQSWSYGPMFLFPFTIVGLIFAIRMWTLLPNATRKYLAEVEGKHVGKHTPHVT